MLYRYIYALILYLLFAACKEQEQNPQAGNNENLQALTEVSYPLQSSQDLDVLLEEIGDARFVLLGEASHGTSEFYSWRAEISQRLIEEKGFTIIAVEGDWPALYPLNEYIRGATDADASAVQALSRLERWPTWMWANEEVAEFAEWLRNYNQAQSSAQKAGFYGMDVYSFWSSMEEVIAYLEETDPQAAERAREAYACLAPYNQDEWAYAEATLSEGADCSEELASVLEMLIQQNAEIADQDDAAFNAVQNALTVVNAENYYTTAVRDNAASWNIRDRHMMETINRLLTRQGEDAKIIVWAHNTHVGDARATTMADAGMLNLGQLVREEHGQENVHIVGFGTYTGTVIAGSSWGAPVQEMEVPNATGNSWEALLHMVEPADKIVLVDELQDNAFFQQALNHRAIGVVYNPRSEQGNYVPSIIPQRYDSFIFFDETEALNPLSTSANGRIGAARQILPELHNYSR